MLPNLSKSEADKQYPLFRANLVTLPMLIHGGPATADLTEKCGLCEYNVLRRKGRQA